MINQSVIKQIIQEQQAIRLPEDLVIRDSWKELTSYCDNPHIVVIKGMRRCGKSIALQWLRSREKSRHFYVNFDDDRLDDFTIKDFQFLLETLVELIGPAKIAYFDEIQNIKGFEKFLRRLHDQGYKIYITGSNAQLLSQEFGTHLTGRIISIEMYPYSFTEYLLTKKITVSSKEILTSEERGNFKKLFNEYMVTGGIPDYVRFQQPQYLQDLYDTILYRDIIVRHNIGNERAIKSLTHYLASNPGKNISYNNLKNMLKLASANTVSDYCYFIQMSYLCFIINQYSPSLKVQVHYGKKSYFIDPALAKTVGFQVSEDYGRMLENIVFLELKRRKYDIYFHLDKKECDFVIKKSHRVVQAVQVCAHLDNPEIREREFAGLTEAMQAYQLTSGLILTDGTAFSDKNIVAMPIWKWLLEKF